MLVTFKSKSYADITMLGDAGLIFLKFMDFGTRTPGGLSKKDVGTALTNLRRELDKLPKADDVDDDDADGKPRVSLHTRAIPLIELLEAAKAAENEVRWE